MKKKLLTFSFLSLIIIIMGCTSSQQANTEFPQEPSSEETSCESDADCVSSCKVFTGKEFQEGTSQGRCNLEIKRCECTYF